MKKQSAIFIILGIVLIMGSCTNTPPDLYLSFNINTWSQVGAGDPVNINYTLKNGGDTTLENCKIQFGIDTNNSLTWDYTNTMWTSGVDLSVGESHTDSISIPTTGTAVTVYVIASGWDDPEDKSAARTVIYYDN